MSDQTVPLGPLIIDVAGCELDDEDRALLAHPAVGGAILFTRNFAEPAQLAALTAAMRACRPNLLIMADYEGGRVQRFHDGMTRIPPMRRLGQLWHADQQQAVALAADTGWLIAAELGALGIDLPLAPVVDIDYGRAETAIGSRAFAGEAEVVSALAQAFCNGLTQGGSVATAKHFPGHGHVVPDSHAELPVDERDWAVLQADMAPYRTLIAAGLASIMLAHIRYPAVDELPASLSPQWIGRILRRDLGFAGCVFSDDLSMGGAAALGSYRERVAMALAAGCDYLPVCNNRAAVRAQLADAALLAANGGRDRREHLQTLLGHGERAKSLLELQQNPRWRQARERLCALNGETA
ncbi:MAG TPA: beta-N-acetylhexosaminidase [Salinisphaeraceae bacterium]|nr:beta-N-acetylhexosaminidase [Salinisphaeraceae bacterium]